MQIKVVTDYAIRMVMHMALYKEALSSSEISKKLKIPQSIVLKIGKKLKNSKIVNIIMGSRGGFLLRKKPEEITLLDIIGQFEPTIKISKCLKNDKYCSRKSTNNCPMRKFYCDLQDKLEERFKTTTIQSLIEA